MWQMGVGLCDYVCSVFKRVQVCVCRCVCPSVSVGKLVSTCVYIVQACEECRKFFKLQTETNMEMLISHRNQPSAGE